MLTANGKYINVIVFTAERPAMHYDTATGSIKLGVASADLRAQALSAAQAIVANSTFSFAPITVQTALGKFKLTSPPTTGSRVCLAMSNSYGGTTPMVYAQAPAHKQVKTVSVDLDKGLFVTDMLCALMEVAIQYTHATRIKQSPSVVTRMERLSSKIDELIGEMQVSPFGITGMIDSRDGLWMSVSENVWTGLAKTAIPTADITSYVEWYIVTYMDSLISLYGANRASIKSQGVTAASQMLRYKVNVGQASARQLTNAEIDNINLQMGSLVSQPTAILDILGSNMESVDAAAYVDLLAGVVQRLSETSGLEMSFSTTDSPRSLEDLLFFNMGVTDGSFIESITAFYHRSMRPTMTSGTWYSLFEQLANVHPAFIEPGSSGLTWSWSGNRVLTFKNGATTVAVWTYPDYLNKDIRYWSSSQTAVDSARGVILAYHAYIDYVYSLITFSANGSISPERAAQIGLNGLVSSNIVSVRAA